MEVLTVALLVALSVSVAARGMTQELKINASSTYASLSANGTAIISKQPDIVNDANKITVRVHRLEQVASDGSSVRKEDLSSLNFRVKVGPMQNRDFLLVRTESTAKINGGTFVIQFTMVKRRILGKEGWDVGDIVISFQLSGYAFSKEDNKLKMTIMIKGNSASTTKINGIDDRDMVRYDLGGNGVLKLSEKVTLTADGNMFTIESAKEKDLYHGIVIKPADVFSSSSGSSDTNMRGGDGSTKITSLGLVMMVILML